MTKALLTFEIDRVAEFIGNSRKSRDAWLGSWIVSYLMARVGAKAGEVFGWEFLRYPSAQQPIYEFVREHRWPADMADDAKRVSSLPDRLLLEVDSADALADDSRKIHAVCDELENAWEAIWEASRGILASLAPALADSEQWRQQCQGFFRLHWALTEMGNDDALDRHYRALAAVNSSRTFAVSVQPGVKCSLSGEYSALPTGERAPQVRSAWKAVAQRHATLVRPSERLSAVYAAKRFAGHGKVRELLGGHPVGFPSLASIASAPSRAQMLAGAEADVRGFVEALGRLLEIVGDDDQEAPIPGLRRLADTDTKLAFARLDGEWLFDDSYQAAAIAREHGVEAGQVAPAAQAAAQALGRLRRSCGAAAPRPYYAAIVMDGDGISGKLARVGDQVATLATQLSRFGAARVPAVIHGRLNGQLVYAGGDELLAFASVEEALPLIQAIRAEFGRETGLSMSAGVVISHIKSPLRAALQQAGKAIERAKGQGKDRGNGVYLLLNKRSGAPVDLGWKFSDDDIFAFLAQTRELRQCGRLGRGFLTDLAADYGVLLAVSPAACLADARRLLRRHKRCPRAERQAPYWQEYEGLIERLIGRPTEMPQLLGVADWLARGGQ